jgi:type IV secretory pathway VirB4 component
LNFDDLKSIIDTENDQELKLTSNSWEITKNSNSELKPWLSEDQFNQVFSNLLENQKNDTVFVFESFERIYKDSGLTKRLTEQLDLNWANFNAFQSATEILYFYMVPKSLNWVLYANRDFWQFAKGN